MSIIENIKQIRDTLAEELLAARQEHSKQEAALLEVSAALQAAAATVEAKVRFLANLDALLRAEDGPLDTGACKTRNGPAEVTQHKRPNVQEGRRAVAAGLRPPIKDAIASVMGTSTMTIEEIFEGLRAKNWLPNSSEPRQYISYLLSTSKERFEKVPHAGRGVYRGKIAPPRLPPASSEEAKKPILKKPKAILTTDEILAHALGDAVFGG